MNITIGLDNAAMHSLSSIQSARRTRRRGCSGRCDIWSVFARINNGKDIYIYNFSRDACTENARE